MSVRRIDFGGEDFDAHLQAHWMDFAGRPDTPDYLRIVFVAYGKHKANGHAKLDREELRHLLVRKDGTLPDRRNVWASIRKAVRLGYLDIRSQMLCLVVPGAHVQGGRGNPSAPCPRDHTKKENVVDGLRRSGGNVVNLTGRSETNVVNDSRRSTLSLSPLSTNATEDAS
jgi:hypothetical protein